MAHLTVISKREAMRMQVDSLFTPVNGGTLSVEKLCTGKYNESIKTRILDVSDDVHAVWAERRADKHGPYYTLQCLTSRSN